MNHAAEIIHHEIQRNGTISFARFMELALYAPNSGYYEQKKDIGRKGDFFTSVSVGSLFGELLAFQFAEWLVPDAHRPWVQMVEAGSHDGRLASDLLKTIQQWHPEIFRRLEYWILEPSRRHEEWQRQTLAEFENKIRWFSDWSALPATGVHGVIFSNELLDAMPVQAFRWDSTQKTWVEKKVAWQNNHFVWREEIPCAEMKSRLSQFVGHATEQLTGDLHVELSPAAERWWQNAAQTLRSGQLLAIDYGFHETEHPFSQSTLRAYFRHQVTQDVLAVPGEQDLTAHVNFTALQRVGEAAGLQTATLVSQARFLTQIIERGWKNPSRFLAWDSSRTRQFQTLTHPEHLGRAFKVLQQYQPLSSAARGHTCNLPA